MLVDHKCVRLLDSTIEKFDLVGFIALLVLTAMGCGMKNLCKKSERADNIYQGHTFPWSSNLLREDR